MQFAKGHPEYAYLGINVADKRDAANDFVREFGWKFPSLVDPNRELAGRLGAAYQPMIVLLDEEGRIVGRRLDGDEPSDFEALAAGLRR